MHEQYHDLLPGHSANHNHLHTDYINIITNMSTAQSQKAISSSASFPTTCSLKEDWQARYKQSHSQAAIAFVEKRPAVIPCNQHHHVI